MPELGMIAEKCDCTEVCRKGVEPIGDCVCKLPGEVKTANCDVCDPTHQRFTWHHDGQCLNCIRTTREQAKARAQERHAKIMQAAPNPVQLPEIEEADYRPRELQQIEAPMQIVLRIKGVDIVLTDEPNLVANAIRATIDRR